mgnify:CR=1 FL=1
MTDALTLRKNPLQQISGEEYPQGANVNTQEYSAGEVRISNQNIYSSPNQSKHKSEKRLSISIIVSLFGIIPVYGILPAVVGIIIGFFELKSRVRTQAIAGIILGFVGICFTVFLVYVDYASQWCTFFPILDGCP